MNHRKYTAIVKKERIVKTRHPLVLLLGGVVVWCAAILSSVCCGEEGLPEKSALSLSLKQSVELMLTNNLDLKVERYNPFIEEKEITKEKAEFDPLARFSLHDNKLVVSPTTFLNGVWNRSYEEERIDYESSMSKKFITGGVGELKFTTNRFETNSFFQYISPTYYSSLVFSLNQPLLRNFGITLNKSRITISSNHRDISHSRLKDKTITMITALQQLYWNLYLSQQVRAVKQSSLQLARDLLERNRVLVEVGKLPSVEIVRAQTGVASREEGVIIAENTVDDVEDVLMETFNLPLGDRVITLLDTPMLKEPPQVAAEDYLKVALENRPDYEETKIHLKNLEVAHQAAKNAMLPLFDLQASYGINATRGHHEESVEGLHTGGDYSWLVGFKLEIPLGNRWAKSNYEKSRLEVTKATTSIESLEKKIELEIREALREIESSYKRIYVTQEARRMAEKNLEAEEERMNLGMSTSVDVLRFQEELTTARCSETNALVDYINALSVLHKVTGTTLETYQISLKES